MNFAFAGIGSIFAALYLAARTHGLGIPLEEQPVPEKKLDPLENSHLTDAQTFASLARAAVTNARDAVTRRDCRKTHNLLNVADAALINMAAHAQHVPARFLGKQFHGAYKELRSEFDGVCAMHDATCTSR